MKAVILIVCLGICLPVHADNQVPLHGPIKHPGFSVKRFIKRAHRILVPPITYDPEGWMQNDIANAQNDASYVYVRTQLQTH